MSVSVLNFGLQGFVPKHMMQLIILRINTPQYKLLRYTWGWQSEL